MRFQVRLDRSQQTKPSVRRAAVTTAYILVGIALEERDLVEQFGSEYRRYRERVPMLFPWRKSTAPAEAQTNQPRPSMADSQV